VLNGVVTDRATECFASSFPRPRAGIERATIMLFDHQPLAASTRVENVCLVNLPFRLNPVGHSFSQLLRIALATDGGSAHYALALTCKTSIGDTPS
jgi:hypothetical protein